MLHRLVMRNSKLDYLREKKSLLVHGHDFRSATTLKSYEKILIYKYCMKFTNPKQNIKLEEEHK